MLKSNPGNVAAEIDDVLVRFAPDLDWPSRLSGQAAEQPFETNTFDPSGTLTEALGLSGKFAIYGLMLQSMPVAELCTVKLTVDGEIIWNAVDFTPGFGNILLLGDITVSASNSHFAPFMCESLLSLEVQTAADNSVILQYLVRPIK